MECDICGKKADKLYEVEVEGTLLHLCEECKRFGKEIKKPKLVFTKKPAALKEDEPNESIRPDFSLVIKQARQKLGMKQEEVAKRINEKASLMHSIETGKHEPSIPLARKLEKFFGISLIENIEAEKKTNQKKDNSALTIGDIINLKK